MMIKEYNFFLDIHRSDLWGVSTLKFQDLMIPMYYHLLHPEIAHEKYLDLQSYKIQKIPIVHKHFEIGMS